MKPPVDWDNLAESYLLDCTSLKSLLRINGLPFSKSTLWIGIRRVASKAPSGIAFSEKVKLSGTWGSILNLDTSSLKFRKRQYSYLQFSDIQSGDQLDYGISKHEDKETVMSHLGKIRYRLGYIPKLVVSDLAPELVEAVRVIYPGVPIQGCLFHLEKLLNKKLPTWKLEGVLTRNQISLLTFAPKEPIGPQPSREGQRLKMKHWAEIKKKIMEVVRSRDRHAQQIAIAELQALDTEKDQRGHRVIEYFLGKQLNYYYSRDELEAIGITEDTWYSNRCENDIGRIKRLWSIHKGFKSPEAAQKYIDFYWWKQRASRVVSEDLTYYLSGGP